MHFNPFRPNPGQREKINLIFTILCGASKGFMEAFKAFFNINFLNAQVMSFELPKEISA